MNTDDNECIASGHHPSRYPCHRLTSQPTIVPVHSKRIWRQKKQARTLHCQTLGKSLECFFDHVLLFDADAPQSPPVLSPDR